MKKRFAVTTVLNAVGVGIGFVTSMLLTPVMIHSLGLKGYGVWVLITSFSIASGYLSILDLGIQSAVVKFVAEYHVRGQQRELDQVISAGLYLFCALGALGAVAVVVFGRYFLVSAFHVPVELVATMRLLLYLLAIQTFFEFPGLALSAVADGLQRYDLQRAAQIAYIVLYSVLIYLLLRSGYRLTGISVAVLSLAIGRTVFFAILARKLMPALRLTRRFDFALLRRVGRFSSDVFLIRLNAIVYYVMDKTIIAAMLSTTLLTQYDVASKLRNVALVSLSLITPQIVPIAARLCASSDRAGLQVLFLKATKYQLAITIPAAMSVYILAAPFIRLWVGPAYDEAAALARLFIVYVILDAVVAVGYNVMVGIHEVRSLVLVQLLTTTGLNLVLSVALTHCIGLSGVVWGTVIGTAASVVPYCCLYSKRLGISWTRLWRETLLAPAVLSVLFVCALNIVLVVLPPTSFARMTLAGAIATGCYFAGFWMGGLSREERRSIRGILIPQPATSV